MSLLKKYRLRVHCLKINMDTTPEIMTMSFSVTSIVLVDAFRVVVYSFWVNKTCSEINHFIIHNLSENAKVKAVFCGK